jgi:nitroimidazol reductase NimA-like FMN-containing flavoprotein (pyridoxamine 5'-phosphate oxidase superfamily)
MTVVAFSSSELDLVRSHDVCRIATISPNRWPHCVPVGYLYKNRQFYVPVSKKSKKVKNLRTNPRACIVIDDEEERVLMIQGLVEIVEGERFVKLKRWMTEKTGWTLGSEREGAILVLTPKNKSIWKLT